MRNTPRRRPRRPGRPPGTGDDIVDDILDATAEALGSVGIAALSVADVARAAGLTRAAVYRRYPTKEELVVAVATRVLARLATGTTAARAMRAHRGIWLALTALLHDASARLLARKLHDAWLADLGTEAAVAAAFYRAVWLQQQRGKQQLRRRRR